MDFPASQLIGKRVNIVFRYTEEVAGIQRLVTIGNATVREAHGDWMLVELAQGCPAWVNLQHVLYISELKSTDKQPNQP